MSELQNSVEQVVSVGVGSSLVTGAALLVTKVDKKYLTNTLTNNVFSLSAYSMLGSVLGAYAWYSFRNTDSK
tara:strand:- start:147 stop:362 length:216 start_codon:yes stop_codon:yes gene_type:complete